MRGTQARLFYGYYNLSPSTSEVEISMTANELEKDVLTSTVREYAPGTTEIDMSINGYLEGIDGGSEEALNTVLDSGTEHVALVLDYSTIPAPTYVITNAFSNGITWTAPFDGLMTANGSVRGSAGGTRGSLVIFEEEGTTTGATSSVQVSTIADADEGRVFMFLHSVTGTIASNVVIQVQSSDDNSTWDTIATFTMDSLQSNVATVTYTGPYIRANVTSLGGTTAIVYSVIVVED